MITNDPVLITDPFDSICIMLETQLKSLVPSMKYAIQGWPDPKWLEDTGSNLPSVFFVNVSDKGKSMTSRNRIFTSIDSGTLKNVYYERERLQYLLQISLFTTDPQERLDIGWQIKQYLINTIQFQLNAVDTARFTYTGHDHMPPGRDNLYQRDLGFEVTARVLDGEQVNVNKTIQQNNTIS